MCEIEDQKHRRLTHELYPLSNQESTVFGDVPEVISQTYPKQTPSTNQPETKSRTNDVQISLCEQREQNACRLEEASFLPHHLLLLFPLASRGRRRKREKQRAGLGLLLLLPLPLPFSFLIRSTCSGVMRAISSRRPNANPSSCGAGASHGGARRKADAALYDRTASTNCGSGSFRTPDRCPHSVAVFCHRRASSQPGLSLRGMLW